MLTGKQLVGFCVFKTTRIFGFISLVKLSEDVGCSSESLTFPVGYGNTWVF